MQSKTQKERLDYLLREFKEDSGRYRDLEVGESYEEKRMALRSLMNIHMPGDIDGEVLKVQDEFLTEEAREKGIVTLAELPSIKEQYGSSQPFADRISTKYVIHTVGPIVGRGLNEGLCQDLKNCYQNVLKCCVEHGIRSVAFCCISTGEFHFPNDEAAKIAVETVREVLDKYETAFDRVIFNVFKDLDKELYEGMLV